MLMRWTLPPLQTCWNRKASETWHDIVLSAPISRSLRPGPDAQPRKATSYLVGNPLFAETALSLWPNDVTQRLHSSEAFTAASPFTLRFSIIHGNMHGQGSHSQTPKPLLLHHQFWLMSPSLTDPFILQTSAWPSFWGSSLYFLVNSSLPTLSDLWPTSKTKELASHIPVLLKGRVFDVLLTAFFFFFSFDMISYSHAKWLNWKVCESSERKCIWAVQKKLTGWKSLNPGDAYCSLNQIVLAAKVNGFPPWFAQPVPPWPRLSPHIVLTSITLCHDPSLPIFLQDARQKNADGQR